MTETEEQLQRIEAEIRYLKEKKKLLQRVEKIEKIITNSEHYNIICKYFETKNGLDFSLKGDYSFLPNFWIGTNAKPKDLKIYYGSLKLRFEDYTNFLEMINDFKIYSQEQILEYKSYIEDHEKVLDILDSITQEVEKTLEEK